MSPHIFIFRFRNILVSYQAVPLTFYNKIALVATFVMNVSVGEILLATSHMKLFHANVH